MPNFNTKTFTEFEILTAKTQNILKEELLKKSNICPLCGNELKNPVLDHQHLTKAETPGECGAGLIRGLLCRDCNAFEGRIENNSKRHGIKDLPNFLRNLADYLEAPNLPYLHSSESWRLKTPLGKAEYNKLIKLYCEKFNKSKDSVTKKYKYSKYWNKNLRNLQLLVAS